MTDIKKPLGFTVLLTEVEKEKQDTGGIVLPDTVQGNGPRHFKVKQLGTAEGAQEFPVSVGDIVIANETGITQVNLGGEPHFIVECSKLLAILT